MQEPTNGKDAIKKITLLAIDDDAAMHRLVDFNLEGVVDKFIHAMGGAEGLKLAIEKKPDVILMDVDMPDLTGFQVCLQLKEADLTRDIPIVFMTEKNTPVQAAKALDSGGSDYIGKRNEAIEMQARVRAAVRSKRFIDLLKDRARIDALTGLDNRSAFDAAIDAAVSRHQRRGVNVGLLMLNVDHLRKVNRDFGYTTGDDLVLKIGALLQQGFRPYDAACRYENDTFAIILCPTDLEGANLTAQRILEQIQMLKVISKGNRVPVSVSGGLVVTPKSATRFTSEELIEQAIDALKKAKNAGRGRIEVVTARESRQQAKGA